MVIFGASGDLTRRKLFPALYALAYRRLLPERFGVVGVARTEQTTSAFVTRDAEGGARVRARPVRARRLGRVRRRHSLRRHRLRLGAGEDAVQAALDELDEERGTSGQPPPTTSPCRRRRSSGGARDRASGASSEGWVRVIVEKPFGHDLASALAS